MKSQLGARSLIPLVKQQTKQNMMRYKINWKLILSKDEMLYSKGINLIIKGRNLENQYTHLSQHCIKISLSIVDMVRVGYMTK